MVQFGLKLEQTLFKICFLPNGASQMNKHSESLVELFAI